MALAIFALRFLSDFILKHLSLFTACKPRRAKSRSLLSSGSKTHFLNLAQAISFYVSESWVNCPPITQSSKCLESLDNQTKQSLPPGLGKGPTFAKHLVCVCVCSQLCLTLCDPMNSRLPGFSVHGIFPGQSTGAAFSMNKSKIWLQEKEGDRKN